MSSLSIKFDPPIALATQPVTQEWIGSIDWPVLIEGGPPEPKYRIRFHIDDQWLEYSRESLGNCLHDLFLMWDGLRRQSQSFQVIEGDDILMVVRSGDLVHFGEPVDWKRSPKVMPEDLEVYDIGAPISWEAVDVAFREAIAAAWRQFELLSNN